LFYRHHRLQSLHASSQSEAQAAMEESISAMTLDSLGPVRATDTQDIGEAV